MFQQSPIRRSAVIGLLAAATLVLAGAAPSVAAPASPVDQGHAIRGAGSPSAIPDNYIVKLKDTGSAASQDAPGLAKTLGSRYEGKVGHVWTHAIRGFSITMSEAAAEKLATDPAVAYIEQDRHLRSAGTGTVTKPGNASTTNTGQTIGPNVVQTTTTTWGLDRVDQRKLPLDQKYHYDTPAGQGVTAYIISTGLRISHEDFGGRAFYGPNFANDNHTNSDDCVGGGTYLAGIVGGAEFGVAKQADLVGVRAFDCRGVASLTSIQDSLDWVAGHASKPAVAALDLGDLCDGPGTPRPCDSDLVASVIEAEEGLVASGILLVVGAGNSNADACTRSSGLAPDLLYVGATGITDTKAGFSNYGDCVDIWAPGQAINSDWNASDIAEQSANTTSGAAAHVAGAAALLLSDPKFANASPGQLTFQLVEKQASRGFVIGLDPDSPNRLLFTNPPGSFTTGSSVKLTANANGNLNLFGTNTAGFILQRSQITAPTTAASAATWGPWIQSATSGWDSVTAARNADGRIELIGLTQSHELWHRQQTAANASTWLGWSKLNTPTTLGLSAASVKLLLNNRLMMFGADQDGKAYFRAQTAANATTWGAWIALPFPGQVRSITAESNTDGKIEVFVTDTDSKVWRSKQLSANDTNWSAFTQITGTTMGVVSVAHNKDGRLDIFGTDSGGVLRHASQTGAGATTYTSWTALPSSAPLRSVSAETNSAGLIDVIAVDASGNVWESLQSTANSTSYLSFANIGGALRP